MPSAGTRSFCSVHDHSDSLTLLSLTDLGTSISSDFQPVCGVCSPPATGPQEVVVVGGF